MRDLTSGIIWSRMVLDRLTYAIDSSRLKTDMDYSGSWRYLHDGLIVFDGVFLEPFQSVTKLFALTLTEMITGGTLLKPSIKILFFREGGSWESIPPTKDSVFTLPSELTGNDILGWIDISSSDWVDFSTNGQIYIAKARKSLDLIVNNASNRQNLYAVAVFTGATGYFSATANLFLDLEIEQT